MRNVLGAIALVAMAGTAEAGPSDIVFKGALVVTSTTGCTTGWNPVGEMFIGTLWPQVTGSVNNRFGSTLTLHSEGIGSVSLVLPTGVFTTAYKPVTATSIYTLVFTYSPTVKFATQSPAGIITTTQSVSLTGSVKGWDNYANCIVNFKASLLRDPTP